jgi:DNA-binding NarL/FixJ family response regulator
MTEKEPITVAVVDHDSTFFRHTLAALRKEDDIKVCVSICLKNYRKESSLDEASIRDILHIQPRVLLFSQMVLREAAAINLKYIMKLRDTLPHLRTVITIDHYVEETALIGIREGIRGFYMRKLGTSKIVSCVRTVARGEVWLEAPLISRVIEEFSKLYRHVDSLQPPTKVHEGRLSLLSPRELEILNLISKSYTNDDIAKSLFISEKTVKTHIRNIFEKTGLRNRAEAMLLVVRSGLAS